MINLRQLIREQIAKLKESKTYDSMDADPESLALDLLDACEGDLGDTIAINDWFRRNQITDRNKKQEILKAAGKAKKKSY